MKILSERHKGVSCPCCAIQSLCCSNLHRSFGCVGLWSEWSESASEPLDIESQQLRARCASPRDSVIVHLFSEELVGWLDDLSLKSMSPPHPPTRLPVCVYVCDPRAHSDIQSVTDIDYCRLDAKSTGEQTETKKKKKGWGCWWRQLLIDNN